MKVLIVYFDTPEQHDEMVREVNKINEFREYFMESSYIGSGNVIYRIAYRKVCPRKIIEKIKRRADKIANKKVNKRIVGPSLY